jgi:hypothetical protein
MAAKFEITKDKAGKLRFHLKVPNGEIIAARPGLRHQGQRREGRTGHQDLRCQCQRGRQRGIVVCVQVPV